MLEEGRLSRSDVSFDDNSEGASVSRRGTNGTGMGHDQGCGCVNESEDSMKDRGKLAPVAECCRIMSTSTKQTSLY